MSKLPTKLEEALKQLKKKYGETCIQDYEDTKQLPAVEKISTGLPSLDLILGGGVPVGRIMEVYGPYSSGKSTLAIIMLAKCQQKGKPVVYIDIENSFDPVYAATLGLDVSKNFYLSQPNSGEEAMDIVEKFCQSGEIGAIVIDSVAQLVPMSVAAKEIDGTMNIASTARLLSQTLPRVSNAASRSGTVLIFLNQIRSNVGVMYGPTEISPGGHALKFAASIRIEVRASKAEERDGHEGFPVNITVKKNKVGKPFRKTSLFFIFGKGFDYVSDLLTTAQLMGVIEQAGAWFTYKDLKTQGLEKMKAELAARPEYLSAMEKTLSEIRV